MDDVSVIQPNDDASFMIADDAFWPDNQAPFAFEGDVPVFSEKTNLKTGRKELYRQVMKE